MAIIETCIKTIDFYDTSDTIKEQKVERYIFGTGCTSENILHSKHLMNGNCCVTNNVTGEEINFDSRDAFESWKAIVSLDELINCVIVIQSEGEYSKATTRYHFEDVTLSASKRIKLYNFEVLDKDTGELVPNVSFQAANCSRGLNKIADAIKGKENNHIVRLNGFDITEHFMYGISYSVSCLKTEEKDCAFFKIVYFGPNKKKERLKEKISALKRTKSVAVAIMSTLATPDQIEKAKLEADKEIQALEDQLKSIDKS